MLHHRSTAYAQAAPVGTAPQLLNQAWQNAPSGVGGFDVTAGNTLLALWINDANSGRSIANVTGGINGTWQPCFRIVHDVSNFEMFDCWIGNDAIGGVTTIDITRSGVQNLPSMGLIELDPCVLDETQRYQETTEQTNHFHTDTSISTVGPRLLIAFMRNKNLNYTSDVPSPGWDDAAQNFNRDKEHIMWWSADAPVSNERGPMTASVQIRPLACIASFVGV